MAKFMRTSEALNTQLPFSRYENAGVGMTQECA